jgi:4-amino-4-deoxy-L-arabinose transferase-like glycosyltransferase
VVSDQRMTQHAIRTTRAEWVVVIALLLVATAFRFYALADLPLGLDQDEIINAIAARGILAGERPIFITAGWGREPLYVYAVAGVASLVGDMTFGMRLTTVAFSMLFLSVAYITAHRLLGRRVALMTLGWLAVSFWPLMTARAGERNILLALFTTLTVYLFHRALFSGLQSAVRGQVKWTLAGCAMGVTLWTYQSSRVMPLVLVVFAAYLAIFERATFRASWKGIVVFFLVGGLIASPLFAYLATHPGAETGDFKTLSLRALQQGDWHPMISAALGALGMFFVRGEIYWLHNIPGRPIFDWLSSVLCGLGLGAVIWSGLIRKRLSAASCVLALLWLGIGLVPAMVTDPPSHHRAANVMAVAYLLPALGADWIGRALRVRSTLYVAAIVAVLAWTGVTTANDFFNTWAVAPEVRDLRFAKLAQLSRDLDRGLDTSPVVVAGTFIEDIEPLVPVALMRRRDISFRWYDEGSAQVIPGQVSRARYFDPASGLRAADTDALRRDLLERASAAPDVWLAPLGDALPTTAGRPAARPISFDGRIEFLGAEISPPRVTTFWRILRDGSPSSTAMFVHLTTPDLKIIAQDDRLGFPTHSWHAGDVFTQAFTLNVPTLPHQAWLEIGIYDRATGQRWQVTGAPGVNRVLTQWSVVSGQWSVSSVT